MLIDAALKLVRPLVLRTLRAPLPSGPLPRSDRGSALDPHIARMLWLSQWLVREPTDAIAPEAMRAETLRNSLLVAPSPPSGVSAEDTTVAGRRARLYAPSALPAPSPLLVFFHGGGFVVGDLESHDSVCRCLARAARCRVLAVDYRLAPEHPFPTGVEDALAAFREVAASPHRFGADPGHIAVGGDSAGGNLSAVVSWRCRDAGGPMPSAQVLIYPGLDLTCSMPSHTRFSEGFYLTSALIGWFLDRYLTAPSQALDPSASPHFLGDLRGLPPAVVVSAGFDPLRDEAESYAERLVAAGVPVRRWCEERLIHGFANMAGASPRARSALERAGRELQALAWAS